jgi:hypothetical protein
VHLPCITCAKHVATCKTCNTCNAMLDWPHLICDGLACNALFEVLQCSAHISCVRSLRGLQRLALLPALWSSS